MAELQEKGDTPSHSSKEHHEAHIAKVEEVDTSAVLPKGSVDPIYQAKAKVLNDAVQAIGMGRYQVGVFLVTSSLLPGFSGFNIYICGYSFIDRLQPSHSGTYSSSLALAGLQTISGQL